MIIKLNDIYGGEANVPIADDSWFPHEIIKKISPVSGSVKLIRVSDSEVELFGDFSVSVEADCDRCGQPTRLRLSDTFNYDCIVGEEALHLLEEVVCSEEDVNKLYLKEPVINVGELLREQILLAMPIGIRCTSTCKGLCPSCGTNRNLQACACTNHDHTSPFAVLKNMKGRQH